MIVYTQIIKGILCFIAISLAYNAPLLGQHQKASICNQAAKRLDRLDHLNQPDESILIIEELLPLMQENQCWPIYANCYNGLSAAYYYKRDYRRGKENAQKAAEVAATHLGKGLQYAAAIANLSVFEDYTKSVALQKESLQIEQELGADYQSLIYAIEGLGLTYQDLGDSDTAIDYFKQAIKILQSHQDGISHEEGRLLRQIGSCYLAKGQYQAALQQLKQCMAILDQLPAQRAFRQTRWYAYCNLAKVYSGLEEYEWALFYAKAAIALQEELELLEEYQTWITIGDIYFAQQAYPKALTHYARARAESQKEFKDYRYKVGLSQPHRAMARTYHEMGAYDKALQWYAQAFRLIAIDFDADGVIENPPIENLVNSFEALKIFEGKINTLLAYHQEQPDKALLVSTHATCLQAVQLVQNIRTAYLAEGSKHTLLEKVHPLYEKAIQTALQLHQMTGDPTYQKDALMWAESSKAVLLYESVKNRTAKQFANISMPLLEQERSLRLEQGFYKKLILEEKQKKNNLDEGLIQEYENQLFQLTSAYQELEEALIDRYPEYKHYKQETEPLGLKSIQEQLPDSKTAIIEFVVGHEKVYGFFITQDQLFVRELCDSKPLLDAVEKLHPIISNPPKEGAGFKEDYQLFSKLTHFLYEQLLAEGLAAVPEEVDQLIMIPDDLLNYLPFELLTTQTETKPSFLYQELPFLFKKYSIGYHYSASLASFTPAYPRDAKQVFVGFAPSFNEGPIAGQRRCAGEQLFDLFCNEEEVIGIQADLGGTIYADEQATVDAFNRESANYQILHLATHACLHEEEAGLNKIFFSRQEYLTQEELGNMELNADLIVLSACNTGRGRLLKGEGVMSLARCFLLAGSRSILTSFWSVDDCATSAIMKHYYDYLGKGQTKSDAIALAKLAYMKTADQNNGHPYYWGAFVQFGELHPLNSSQSLSYWPYLLLIVALFLFLWIRQAKS